MEQLRLSIRLRRDDMYRFLSEKEAYRRLAEAEGKGFYPVGNHLAGSYFPPVTTTETPGGQSPIPPTALSSLNPRGNSHYDKEGEDPVKSGTALQRNSQAVTSNQELLKLLDTLSPPERASSAWAPYYPVSHHGSPQSPKSPTPPSSYRSYGPHEEGLGCLGKAFIFLIVLSLYVLYYLMTR